MHAPASKASHAVRIPPPPPLAAGGAAAAAPMPKLLKQCCLVATLSPHTGASLNQHTWASMALQEAARLGGAAEVAALLTAGAAVDAANEATRGQAALHAAAGKRQVAAMRLLLAAGASPLVADDMRDLPLHKAALCGCEAAVRLLAEAAPDAALVPKARLCLTLHVAALAGNAAAARALVQAAPQAALARDGRQVTTLMQACRFALRAAQGGPAGDPAGKARRRLLGGRGRHSACHASRRGAGTAGGGGSRLPAGCCRHPAPALLPAGGLQPAQPAQQWALVPSLCAALRAALPAVLRRSEAEAALLLAHLPPAARERLRTAAQCLQQAGVRLPEPLVRGILAFCLSDC